MEQTEHTLFGPEWEKEMQKWSKADLINQMKEILQAEAASAPSVSDLQANIREWIRLFDPIHKYAKSHPKCKLGTSVTQFVLDRAKRYDQLTASQSGQIAGMQWVKASERMPVEDTPLSLKVDGKPKTGAWVEEAKAFMIDGYRYPPMIYFIEWLDEIK